MGVVASRGETKTSKVDHDGVLLYLTTRTLFGEEESEEPRGRTKPVFVSAAEEEKNISGCRSISSFPFPISPSKAPNRSRHSSGLHFPFFAREGAPFNN
ncbi:hypothetical protein EYF80_029717 [Liparis tanakae]|uniref:Uncharacterized protein n=1 Tax=Liparis tanakae TaxID=230148 RepID=A0A4Z2H2F3_9TELE|nr:hypothetical protein EYF80_029717 [Liparis tanakae]